MWQCGAHFFIFRQKIQDIGDLKILQPLSRGRHEEATDAMAILRAGKKTEAASDSSQL